LSGARRDGLALPPAEGGQAGSRGVHRGQGRCSDRDAPCALARRDSEGARARDPRRGAALRRCADGAAEVVAARGRCADAERDAAEVLVLTTCIESAIEMPQASTLVVERADMLGLAQLYQMRGRVGRSDETAHAYLFYPDAQELTADARARLATLADHTELGAGFAIAMRDLEIRGAGELLGAEQSGHVAALGFELYVELLAEAVAELSGERRIAVRPVRVDARVDAYVPADYIGSEALKIDLHRRLALSESEDELRELQAATEDRFGPLPDPV